MAEKKDIKKPESPIRQKTAAFSIVWANEPPAKTAHLSMHTGADQRRYYYFLYAQAGSVG